MKTKTIILLGAVALVTLSFTFATVKKEDAKNPATEVAARQQSMSSEPIGGFAAETLVK
jgi:hypothetical protein